MAYNFFCFLLKLSRFSWNILVASSNALLYQAKYGFNKCYKLSFCPIHAIVGHRQKIEVNLIFILFSLESLLMQSNMSSWLFYKCVLLIHFLIHGCAFMSRWGKKYM